MSLRDLPVYVERFPIRTSHQRALSIGTDMERRVWEHQRVAKTPRNYKVVMKQVVGVPFSGALSPFLEADQEQEVLKTVVEASEQDFDNPYLTPAEQHRKLEACLTIAHQSLKELLQTRIRVYLLRVVQRLLDPENIITWNPWRNNCQTFCNSLLDTSLYAPLVNGPPQTIQGGSPLYLMSFVSSPTAGYSQDQVTSKYDVPMGFIEQYLQRMYFGRQNDSDIIDSLQEYWHDWGAFTSPLYKYQDMFPWDCSEAYGRCPIKCGDCNLSKHVWACPFDSWSIATQHLQREQYQYPGFETLDGNETMQKWARMRFSILQASSTLNTVAAGMAASPKLIKASSWLQNKDNGLLALKPSLTRVAMGGYHRAQPFSHNHDTGLDVDYFLAPWAVKDKDAQKADYEAMRDQRMNMDGLLRTMSQKYYSSSKHSGRLEWYGFEGPDKAAGLGAKGLSPYYPYYYATVPSGTSGDQAIADSQLIRTDESVGDGSLTKGAEYNLSLIHI